MYQRFYQFAYFAIQAVSPVLTLDSSVVHRQDWHCLPLWCQIKLEPDCVAAMQQDDDQNRNNCQDIL